MRVHLSCLVLMAAMGLSACSNTQDNSFFTDGSSTGTCVTSSCAQSDTSAYMAPKKNSRIYAKAIDKEIEINGECFTANSTGHSITLKLKAGANDVAAAYRGLNIGDSADSTIKCNQGKFSFILNISALAVGNYTIVSQMSLQMPDGSTQTPVSAGFTANLSITN